MDERKITEQLIELLELFALFLYTKYRPTNKLSDFLHEQALWLKSLNNDLEMYDPDNETNFMKLKNFLVDPNPHLVDVSDNYMQLAFDFNKYYHDFASLQINSYSANSVMYLYDTLAKQFAPIVFDLEKINVLSKNVHREGPRDIIQSLTEILHTFCVLITEENEYKPTEEFLGFLDKHLRWLTSLDNDLQLYLFQNKANLTELTGFLKNPNACLKGCITYEDELWDIALGFRRFHSQFATLPINTLVNDYHALDKQFVSIVFELESILERTPPADYATMHENNRDLFYKLNAYILNPKRVKKMASQYGLEPYDYLDAIDV